MSQVQVLCCLQFCGKQEYKGKEAAWGKMHRVYYSQIFYIHLENQECARFVAHKKTINYFVFVVIVW